MTIVPDLFQCLPSGLVNEGGHSTFWVKSSDTEDEYDDTLDATLHGMIVGDKVRYSKDRVMSLVEIVKVSPSRKSKPYTIKNSNGHEFTLSSDYLSYICDPDIGRVPVTAEDYMSLSRLLTQEDWENMVHPSELLNDNDNFFLDWYNKLDHLPAKKMLTLSDNRTFPSRISKIFRSRRLPVCASCLVGKVHRTPWCHKRINSASSRRPSDDVPGGGVSTDQMISSQPLNSTKCWKAD